MAGFVWVLLCCAIGYALAVNHYTAWSLAGFSVVAVVCIQLSYLTTVLLDGAR